MRHAFYLTASLLLLLVLPGLMAAQGESVVTARAHYSEVLAAAQATAPDAALIMIGPGEVDEHGKRHNWGYFFRSVSLNNILLFVYEQDDESVRRVTPIKPEEVPLALHVDMTPIPTSWVDSDVALAEADANGGDDYRAMGGIDNYHVDMLLLPPADGGRNALFKEAAWLVTYTGEPGEAWIPIDAATGSFLDFGTPTARRFLHEVDSLSQSLGNDLELVLVGSGLARPDGTAPMWNYFYRSPGESKFYGVTALGGRLGIVQEPIGESGMLHMDMPALPSNWVDSDAAIAEAEQSGGSTFRQTHPESNIEANLNTPDKGLPEWQLQYRSPTGSQQFIVDAVLGSPTTARDKIDAVLTKSVQVYGDAELILVSAPRIDLDGLALQWSYFFLSLGTPDIFELRVVGGDLADYVYPFGLNGYLDVFMPPIPYDWVDSDVAVDLAEQGGGSQFRQTHDEWKIVPSLVYSEPDRIELEWRFDYQSPSGAAVFEVDGYASNPVTARHLLSDVVAAAMNELGESQLVAVGTPRLDLDGRANQWSYIFKSPGSSSLSEVTVRSGKVLPDLTLIPPDDLLRLDMPALPDQWIDSDSAIAIVEQIGGAAFRQTYPSANIDLICAWQERGPTRARNLGARPMYSVLYESDTGDRFRRAVDLEVGAYETMAATTAAEKLVSLADSVVAAGLPEDAELVEITSTAADYMGYADDWAYLFESPTEQQKYEFRVLGGHVIRLDSVRSGVDYGLGPLPDEWIDSPLALKVAELNGGADFRGQHPDYEIRLDLQVGGEGIFWDVVYGSNSVSERHTVDALDFSVRTEPIDLPGDDLLLQTYPNPFATSATIAFELGRAGAISLTVYDILGRKRVMINETLLQAGPHAIPFPASTLESGAYFVVLRAEDRVWRTTMVKVE